MIPTRFASTLLAVLAFCAPQSAFAANVVRPPASVLPLSAARDAADAAVAKCAAGGHHVTAVVMDPGNQIQVVLRGDGAPPMSMESARLKAFTILSLGPIRNVPNTDALAQQILPDPTSTQLLHIPDILLEPGGVVITRPDGTLVAAIGVAGAPAGTLDQECAQVGADLAGARLMDTKP